MWTLVYLEEVVLLWSPPPPCIGKAGSEFCTFCTLQSLKTDFDSCDLSSYCHIQLIDIKAALHPSPTAPDPGSRQTDRHYRGTSFLIYPSLPIARTTLTPRHGNHRRRCEEGIREVKWDGQTSYTNRLLSLGTVAIIYDTIGYSRIL